MRVRNESDYDGTETVQLYIADLAFAHEDGVYAESGEYSVFVGGDPSALISLNFVYNAEKMRYNGERIKTGELIKPYAETQSEQQRIL